MIIERDVTVRMRDGVALAADVYRPDDDAAHPTLLQRTPYDKRLNALYLHAATIDLVDMVDAGYAVVVQDTRGRFASAGEWEPWVHEAQDGYESVEWVAEQPWCDGHVGVYGNSYMANAALQVAVAAPPHLDAVFAYMGGASSPDGWVKTNGALELSFMYFWLTRGAYETARRHDVSEEPRATLIAAAGRPRRVIDGLPVAELPGLSPELVPFWEQWVDRLHGDPAWQPGDAVARIADLKVPVLHVTGYFDNFCIGHMDFQAALQQHPDERVRTESRFIVGPWDHEAYMSPRPNTAGEIDFGPAAPNGYRLNRELTRKWFDRWLRGDEASVASEPPVSYFETGSDRWHASQQWPPPHEPRSLFLGAGGTLADAPGGAGADAYDYDPLDPVPTAGGRLLCPPLGAAGVADQRAVEARDDVLLYTTEPLTEPLAIAGEIALVLHVESDCEDTDFTAKLVDVEPDGFCRNLAEGITRARHRQGLDREVFLTPGEVVELRIPLQHAAHEFAAGHRLRVEVASSNFPHFDRNLNSRVPPGRGTRADVRVAHNTVHHGGERRSRLELPVAR